MSSLENRHVPSLFSGVGEHEEVGQLPVSLSPSWDMSARTHRVRRNPRGFRGEGEIVRRRTRRMDHRAFATQLDVFRREPEEWVIVRLPSNQNVFGQSPKTSRNSPRRVPELQPLQTLVSPSLDVVQMRSASHLLFWVHWDESVVLMFHRLKLGGNPMMHRLFCNADELLLRWTSKPHYYSTRMRWRTVLIRLDTRCRGVIRSLELRDGEGLSSLWSLRERQRERCAVLWRSCGEYRNSKKLMLRRFWGFDLEPYVKTKDLKNQGFVQGGGRALEPCKSL